MRPHLPFCRNDGNQKAPPRWPSPSAWWHAASIDFTSYLSFVRPSVHMYFPGSAAGKEKPFHDSRPPTTIFWNSLAIYA